MTVLQQKKILVRIAQIEEDIDLLKKARLDAVANGFASATISTSGGSKSYTRLTPAQITNVIDELLKELEQLRSLLAHGKCRPIHTIVTVYC